MTIIPVDLTDEEIKAAAAGPQRTSSYSPAENVTYKVRQACLAALAERAAADAAGDEPALAPPSVAEQTGFAAVPRRDDDAGPGGGEE